MAAISSWSMLSYVTVYLYSLCWHGIQSRVWLIVLFANSGILYWCHFRGNNKIVIDVSFIAIAYCTPLGHRTMKAKGCQTCSVYPHCHCDSLAAAPLATLHCCCTLSNSPLSNHMKAFRRFYFSIQDWQSRNYVAKDACLPCSQKRCSTCQHFLGWSSLLFCGCCCCQPPCHVLAIMRVKIMALYYASWNPLSRVLLVFHCMHTSFSHNMTCRTDNKNGFDPHACIKARQKSRQHFFAEVSCFSVPAVVTLPCIIMRVEIMAAHYPRTHSQGPYWLFIACAHNVACLSWQQQWLRSTGPHAFGSLFTSCLISHVILRSCWCVWVTKGVA